VRFAFIAAEKAAVPVAALCRVLKISRSGFYAWCERPESEHARQDCQLRVRIRASFDASKQRYGSPRIWEDLVEDRIRVSRKRVVRLMQEQGLRARARKRFRSTTMSDHDQPVAANLLNREFTAAALNQRWAGDTTEFVIGGSGKFYLAAILDLYLTLRGGLGRERDQRSAPGAAGARDGSQASLSGRRAPAPLGSGQPVRQRGLPGRAGGAEHHLQHEPTR
jgi:transposase InsO family protein